VQDLAAAGSSRLPLSFDGSTCSVTRPVAIIGRDGDFLPIDPISAFVREMSHDQDSVACLMQFPANVRDSWIMAQHLTDLAPAKDHWLRLAFAAFLLETRFSKFVRLSISRRSAVEVPCAVHQRQGPAISEP
jgi:hypothetical protein